MNETNKESENYMSHEINVLDKIARTTETISEANDNGSISEQREEPSTKETQESQATRPCPESESHLIDLKGVAERCKVNPMTVRRWIDHKLIIPPLRIGNKYTWVRTDLYKWVDDNTSTVDDAKNTNRIKTTRRKPDPETELSIQSTADFLGIKRSALRKLIVEDSFFPKKIEGFGNKQFFLKDDLISWARLMQERANIT